MDYASLPNLIALALLLFHYRPLLQRAHGPARLWFYGWGFMLLNSLNHFLAGPLPLGTSGLRLGLATGTLAMGGLMFLLGSANRERRLVGRGAILSLAAGPLVQALLVIWPPAVANRVLPYSVALYFAPAVFMAVRRPRESWSFGIAAALYAIFGLGSLPLVTQPLMTRAVSLWLIFFCAALFAVRSSRHMDRGTRTTAFGLVLWGLKYPTLLWMHNMHSGWWVSRGFIEIPEYFVLAGSVLSLIEERLSQAERLATHDPLTNLPNRRFLQERFTEALAEARENRTTIACLVIDVDHFKTINDTLGHGAGDAILRTLAVRLAWHLSPRDVLARTGGDEFTAMLAGVSNEHYLRFVAEAMTSAASVPVQVEGKPVEVSISMGIALSPDDADEIEDLVRLADEAMYRSKRRGGNVLCFASRLHELEDEPDYAEAQRVPAGQLLRMTSPVHSTGQRSTVPLHAHKL